MSVVGGLNWLVVSFSVRSLCLLFHLTEPLVPFMLQVGGEKVNTNSVFETDILFMLLIFFRVARAARFIRARTKVKISHGFNWFWLLDVFSPWWWWKRCITKNKTCCSRKEAPILKSSWADVGLGTLATVKAAKLRQEQKNKDSGLFKVHVRVGRYLDILRSGDEEVRVRARRSTFSWRERGSVKIDCKLFFFFFF